MSRRTLRIFVALLVVGFAFVPAGCDDDDPIRPSDAPSDHTVNQDGVGHAPGLGDPDANCAGCHGSDLRGDGDVPSCFSCHGQEW